MLLIFTATSILSTTYAISIENENPDFSVLSQKDSISCSGILAFTFEEKDLNEDNLEQLSKKVKAETLASDLFHHHQFEIWDATQRGNSLLATHLLGETTAIFILLKVFRL